MYNLNNFTGVCTYLIIDIHTKFINTRACVCLIFIGFHFKHVINTSRDDKVQLHTHQARAVYKTVNVYYAFIISLNRVTRAT